MDLSAARRDVKSTTLLKYVAYAGEGVRTAVLNKVVLQANPILSKFVGKSQNLYSLSLLSGGSLQASLDKALERATSLKVLTLGAKVVVSTETLARCLQSCSTLEEVTCDALEMSWSSRLLPTTFQPWVMPAFPRLMSWFIKVNTIMSNTTLVSSTTFVVVLSMTKHKDVLTLIGSHTYAHQLPTCAIFE